MSTLADLFEPAGAGIAGACHLAEVVSVKDTAKLNRVQVRLLAADGVAGQDGPIWARVAVPFAGKNRGAFMLPDKGDEVLVAFVNGDPRLPVVVGSLWNGAASAPDKLGGNGEAIDRWTIVGKAGTRIAIVEERAGEATITLKTPGNVTATITQKSGGKIELKGAGNTVTMDSQGVSIQTSAKVKVQASQVEVTAGMVKVDSAMSKFSGVVKCDVLQATTVVATTYTPGAGNIW
jgi:uncharacterized protein involved in type VI secretion and phage assembly